MSHVRAVPVGGPTWTRTTVTLLLIAIVGVAVIAWRFAVGLGPSTGLSDGYPWGLWIALEVVTGTALACGGYAMALLVYVFNQGKYHALVRPALLTSALGYTIAAIAIAVDVGRPWLIWKIPVSAGIWNLDSALLEVALCVMAYVIVLWIELSPAFLEKWQESGNGLARNLNEFMKKALLWIIALGLLLPSMHQSSLGSVIMLAGPRLHGLWHTGFLPLLFLISCLGMGYAAVCIESILSSRAFGRTREDGMLASLNKAMVFVLLLYVVLRLGDILVAGKAGLLFGSGWLSLMFWLEIALVAIPAFMLMGQRERIRPGALFRAAMMIILAGALYRFDAYLVAFQPAPGWTYFPTIPEIVVSLGLISLEILAYILLVKKLPILSGTTDPVTVQNRGSK